MTTAAAATAAAAAAATALAAAPAAEAATPPTSGSSSMASDLAALRSCESSGNYATNTGNGFYGAYQFDQGTWNSLGYSGLPSSAAPAEQDQAAATLESQRGWEPWPACSARLGLTQISGTQLLPASTTVPSVVSTAAPSTAAVAATAPAAPAPAAVKAVHVPAFPGTVLTTALVNHRRADVAVWQARMVVRGWHLAVDGYFGPQSEGVARAFASEKGVRTALPGQVDSAVWKAAWTAPVTP